MPTRNYVCEQPLRTSMRAKLKHLALGETSTVTVSIHATGVLTGRVVDKIKSDVARHLRLEPAPEGWRSLGFETVEGDFPDAEPAQNAPPDRPEPRRPLPAGEQPTQPATRKAAAQRAAEEE